MDLYIHFFWFAACLGGGRRGRQQPWRKVRPIAEDIECIRGRCDGLGLGLECKGLGLGCKGLRLGFRVRVLRLGLGLRLMR